MKYPPITYSLLKEKKASYDGLQKFEENVGLKTPLPLTKLSTNKFYYFFNIEWSAENLLTKKDYKEYKKVRNSAQSDYTKIWEVARNRYQKKMSPTLTQYKISKQLAKTNIEHHDIFDVYKKVHDLSWVKFVKMTDPAQKKCSKIIAQIFVDIYKKGMK